MKISTEEGMSLMYMIGYFFAGISGIMLLQLGFVFSGLLLVLGCSYFIYREWRRLDDIQKKKGGEFHEDAKQKED